VCALRGARHHLALRSAAHRAGRGAIADRRGHRPWAGGKRRLATTHQKLVRDLCTALDVKPETPFAKLPADLKRIILQGTTAADTQRCGVSFEGVVPNLERRFRAAGTEAGHSRLSGFQAEYVCEQCHGARLQPTSLAVQIATRNIHEFTRLSIAAATQLFDDLKFEGEAATIADPILREIRQRLHFMDGVGLGYLTLDRTSATLSGGEAQRIRLATQLGSGLVGVCYVLDERPSACTNATTSGC